MFSFFLACGDSGYSRHRFSQRKSAAVSGSFPLNAFILFSFPFLSRSHYLFLPVSFVICSKHLPLFFPFCCLCFSSSPSLYSFLSFYSFPFCWCPTLSPYPLLSLVFLSSAVGTSTNRTVNLHCNTEFAISTLYWIPVPPLPLPPFFTPLFISITAVDNLQ